MTIERAAAGVAALALLLTLLVPYENPSGDTAGYALRLLGEDAILVNPNRLLLEPAVLGIHATVDRIAGDRTVDPLDTLLWISRLSYVSSVLLVFSIGALLFSGALRPLAIAVGFAASLAVLYFATDGEPILFAHVGLLLGAALHLWAWRRRSALLHGLSGLAYGGSILVYVSNVIPIAVVGIACVIASSRRRDALALLAPVVAGAVFLSGLIIAHRASLTVLPVHEWVVTYGGGTANLSYGGWNLISLFRVVFGFGGSLVGSRGAARLVRTWTEGDRSVEVRGGDMLELVLWGAAIALAVTLTALSGRRARDFEPTNRVVLVVCGVSVLLLTLFNFQWIGSDPQFWVPVLPLLWIVWGFGLAGARAQLLAVVVSIGLLAPYNVFGSLRPLRGDTDLKLRRMEVMNATDENCLIITPGLDWIDTLTRLEPMGDRTVLSLWRLSTDPRYASDLPGYFQTIESTIATAFAARRRVFVRGVVEEPFERGIPWRDMEPRGFRLEDIQAFLARYRVRPAFENRGQLYRELLPR